VEQYGIKIEPGELLIEIVDSFGPGYVDLALGMGGVRNNNGQLEPFLAISKESWLATEALARERGFTDIEAFMDMQGESVTAHELVHVLTFMNVYLANAQNSADGRWLQEGIADYIPGGNDRIATETKGGTDMTALIAAFEQLKYEISIGNDKVFFDTLIEYAAADLAVRYFDKNNGGFYINADGVTSTGIAALLQRIQEQEETVLDAMAGLGGAYTNPTDLLDDLIADAADLSPTGFIWSVAKEDTWYDYGAIGGWYASGGPALKPGDVIKGNGVFSYQPLEEWGITVKWPSNWDGTTPEPPVILEVHSPLVVEAGANTLQSVKGTLLLHSPLAGGAGKMTISGNERLVKALGFSEVQEAKETVYAVGVSDAHTGNWITSATVTGTSIKGIPHGNIDIRLLNNFGLSLNAANLLAGSGSYVFGTNVRSNSFFVHIAAASVVFQIGANEGETMTVGFGDTSAAALGVEYVNVRDRVLAARAITLIDNAIDKVSMKRARLGAYQNRLEHTVTNLTTAGENLTAAESRIRDADMAKEMLNFTRLQIMLQAGISMLAQANALPRNVLSLLR
jgi:flagellin-like hook-associated protein FlgL